MERLVKGFDLGCTRNWPYRRNGYASYPPAFVLTSVVCTDVTAYGRSSNVSFQGPFKLILAAKSNGQLGKGVLPIV